MPPLDSRPSPLSPGASVGIDEAMIRDVVHAFYGRIREDALLGPIFGRAIADWDRHLARCAPSGRRCC